MCKRLKLYVSQQFSRFGFIVFVSMYPVVFIKSCAPTLKYFIMYLGQWVRILQQQIYIYIHRSTSKLSYLEDSKFTSWKDIFIKTLLLILLFVQYFSTIYWPINHHYKSEINDTTIISTQL